MAATFKLNDNLPMVGRIEDAFYNAARPNKQDPEKMMSPDIRLSGRWTEMTVQGPRDLGPGSVYVRAQFEQDLVALGILAVASYDAAGLPKYRVTHPGPIQILRTAEGTKKLHAITWAGAPGTLAPGPVAGAGAPPQHAPPSAPAPAGPPASNGAGAPARPTPTPAPDEDEDAKQERLRQQFADWLSQGDALCAGLALAHHAAVTAGVPFTPETLQAGAATILIRAEKNHLPVWRGLGEAMVKHLAKKTPPAAPPPPPVTAPPAAKLEAARSAMASAGKRSDGVEPGSGGWDDPDPEDDSGPLPF